MVSSVRGLIYTSKFDEALELLEFFSSDGAGTEPPRQEFDRLRLEIQINVGDIDGAVIALRDMVLQRDSTEAAKVLMDHLIHHGRTVEAEEICTHVVAKIDEQVVTTVEPGRRRALGAGLRYFLGRQLKFATINGRSPKITQELKTRLAPFGIPTNEDHISTLRRPNLLDPQDVKSSKWHVDPDVDYYPEYFLRTIGFKEAIRDLVLTKHPTKTVSLYRDDLVLTYGSCFAANLRLGLKKRGFEAENIDIPEGLNNSFALASYFRWATTGHDIGRGAYDRSKLGDVDKWGAGEDHHQHLQALMRSKLLVITFGLSEIWYERDTEEVFWRGVPTNIYEEEQHAFRVSTVEDNKKNIREMLSVLRSAIGDKPIFLTLSPIPLKATFTGSNCIVADARSKATLRSAIGEILDEIADSNTIYWPSFEMIRWLGGHLDYATLHEHSARYPDRAFIDDIVGAFCDMHLVETDHPQSISTP